MNWGDVRRKAEKLTRVFEVLSGFYPRPTGEGPKSNRAQLKQWVAKHMPELDAELGPMSMDQVRKRLNEVTGCKVRGSDSIEAGSAVFLEVLKRMHEAKESA